jgi:hypothetical protein
MSIVREIFRAAEQITTSSTSEGESSKGGPVEVSFLKPRCMHFASILPALGRVGARCPQW